MNQNFYNGFQNMNNSSFNNQPMFNQNMVPKQEVKPPKKNNLPIIIIAVVAIVAIVVGCILMFGGAKTTSKKENKKEQIKDIEYFNKENKSNDSVFFNLGPISYSNNKGVFFGIKDEGIVNNLKWDSFAFSNDILNISDYSEGDEVSFYYEDDYYTFELENGMYLKDSSGEYYDDDNAIVYRDNKFFVIETNIDNYLIYYLLDEEELDYYNDDDIHKHLYLVNMSFADTINDAKKEIKKIRDTMDICVYDEKEGLDNCLTEDDKKINYKEYRYIKDVLIDTLKNYNLYVNSYEDILYINDEELEIETYVEFDGITEDDLTEFKFDYRDYEHDKEKNSKTIVLNGKEISIEIDDTLCTAALIQPDGYINVYIHLPFEVEKNFENIEKALFAAFSKTK